MEDNFEFGEPYVDTMSTKRFLKGHTDMRSAVGRRKRCDLWCVKIEKLELALATGEGDIFGQISSYERMTVARIGLLV